MTNLKSDFAVESRPAKNIPIESWSVREVTVDIQAADLRSTANGYNVLILRVVGMTSPSGRPVSKSIRIPAEMLKEEWS